MARIGTTRDSVCETMADGGLAVPPHPHFLSACGITVCFGTILAVGHGGGQGRKKLGRKKEIMYRTISSILGAY